ncbi:Mitochondrial matrix Mmp37 [Lasiodiplodia theobromae]|uniref:Phosphatidate cytidylyltransferase, mitochondrial n=1 Tax=Lasiodiplodia theobromae TaxID=45133 RepID=A0A5N5DN46_9PEZI|nr:Mitochondrial matrix Mmp37 [Lasiodiplodia theobromae]KAB2579030.1 Phosphatidate cytidylyltransferase [Lasiodiplodia theobromae]KAF4546448.1 Mitochondrial matrix Mmp37 [Lasiodiplodia theobromae]KAF9630589.1 Mitochondrial matrix Mmp37 [Lasiodiplodia theobromae]
MALLRHLSSKGLQPAIASRAAPFQRSLLSCLRPRCRAFHASFANSSKASTPSNSSTPPSETKPDLSKSPSPAPSSSVNSSLPDGWEDEPNFNIKTFAELPTGRDFGLNQHMVDMNRDFTEALRQIIWQFRAPIRYAFAYGSGVFPQSSATSSTSLSPHPNPPEAIKKWQSGGEKVIDFIFGVTYTQHWHSLNLAQHRDHYSFLGSAGSWAVSQVQDRFGAGVYFAPYITVNGTLIKYGVVNLDTLQRDLSEWNTLYLAGRLQKPVKILRDDARIRLANQVNLISAVRTALLMLPEKFTETQLFNAIAGLSYMGDPRMSFNSENPHKVSNIVRHQLRHFRRLYNPLIETLPNATHTDARVKTPGWELDVPPGVDITMEQDMDPVKRGNMVRRLPKSFREKIYFAYQRQYGISGAEFKKMLQQRAEEDATSYMRRQGGDFDRRIAGEKDLKDKVAQSVRDTVKWPSTVQSLKGLVTAGPARSWRYMSEKWAKGKQGSKEGESE